MKMMTQHVQIKPYLGSSGYLRSHIGNAGLVGEFHDRVASKLKNGTKRAHHAKTSQFDDSAGASQKRTVPAD
jgi:hypothetical protein